MERRITRREVLNRGIKASAALTFIAIGIYDFYKINEYVQDNRPYLYTFKNTFKNIYFTLRADQSTKIAGREVETYQFELDDKKYVFIYGKNHYTNGSVLLVKEGETTAEYDILEWEIQKKLYQNNHRQPSTSVILDRSETQRLNEFVLESFKKWQGKKSFTPQTPEATSFN